MATRSNYVANVLVGGLPDLPVDRPDPVPVRVSSDVLNLYSAHDGGTFVVAAFDENDAERRLIAALGDDALIDDLSLSTDQRPLSIAYTADRVPETAFSLLRIDDAQRPYLSEAALEVEALVHRMPPDERAEYLTGSKPHRALAALDREIERVLEAALPEERRRVFLDARFDISDLTEEEAGQLALEVQAQAERSDGHPGVEVCLDRVEQEVV